MSYEEEGGAKSGVGRDSWCDDGDDHTQPQLRAQQTFCPGPPPSRLSSAALTCSRENPEALPGWPHQGPQEGPGHDCPSRGDYSGQEREGSSPGWLVWQVLAHEDIPGRGQGTRRSGRVSETRLWQRGLRILGTNSRLSSHPTFLGKGAPRQGTVGAVSRLVCALASEIDAGVYT